MSDIIGDLPEPPERSVKWGKSEVWEPYFAALGFFVHNFTVLENWTAMLLTDRLGLTKEAGAAVLSGVRIDACISAIKRLEMSEGGEAARDRLKRMWDHIGLINGVRNGILHHSASVRKGQPGMTVLKHRQAYIKGEVEEFHVSVEDLRNMVLDIQRIISVIMCEYDDVEAGAEKLALPWHYKQPPQAKNRQPPGTKTKRPPRRKSSPG